MSEPTLRGRLTAVAALACLVLSGCGTALTSSTADILPLAAVSTENGLVIDGELVADAALYDAALDDSVTLYSTASQQAEEVVTERFREETGIPITFMRLATNKMSERLQSEAGAGRLDAGVVRLTDPIFADQLGEEGILVPYETPVHEEIAAAGGVLPGGTSMVSYYAAYAIAYNNRILSPEEAPRRWTDLLDPRFDGGQVGTVRGFGSGASVADFVLRNFGEQYWRDMSDGGARVFDSVSVQTEALARGEISVATFPAHSAFAAARSGAPITFVTPEDFGVSAPMNVIGLTQAGLESPAAQVFMNWTMARSSQRFFAAQGYVPARPGVGTPEGVSIRLPEVGTPELQVFTLEDQLTRKDEVLEVWNRAFGYASE